MPVVIGSRKSSSNSSRCLRDLELVEVASVSSSLHSIDDLAGVLVDDVHRRDALHRVDPDQVVLA